MGMFGDAADEVMPISVELGLADKLVVYSETKLPDAEQGYLSIEAIHTAAESDTLFYLSGPPIMINNFRSYLLDQSVAPDAVVVDDWE